MTQITNVIFTPELRQHICDTFSKEAITSTGIDGLGKEPVAFEMRDRETFIGCVVVQMFWG